MASGKKKMNMMPWVIVLAWFFCRVLTLGSAVPKGLTDWNCTYTLNTLLV